MARPDLPDPLDIAALERCAAEGALGELLTAWHTAPASAPDERDATEHLALADL